MRTPPHSIAPRGAHGTASRQPAELQITVIPGDAEVAEQGFGGGMRHETKLSLRSFAQLQFLYSFCGVP